MKLLHPDFLNLLYGDYLYRVPDFNTPPIKYFHKPESIITFFIRDAEFRRKELTDMLKKIVVAMKVPHEKVSFGKIERPAQLEDFQHMQTEYGVIFDMGYFPIATVDENTESKKGIQVVSSLEDMLGNEPIKRKVWHVLKQISEEIHSV